MELTPLSSSLRTASTVVLGLLMALAGGFLLAAFSSYAPWNVVAAAAAVLIVYLLGREYRKQLYQLYFNRQQLVLENALERREIPLTQVHKLTRDTSTNITVLGAQLFACKISFTNEQRETETVRFLVKAFEDEVLEEFKALVRESQSAHNAPKR